MLESPIGFRGSCGAREQTRNTSEWEQRSENILSRKKNSESLAHTHLAVLLRRIMGFRCYSGAADVQVHRQRPKARYQLNTDTPHQRLQRLQGARCAISDTKCSVADFNTPLSLHFFSSHLLLSPLQSLSVKWHRGERAECLCLLTGASEHLKWQRVTLAWVLEKMPQS